MSENETTTDRNPIDGSSYDNGNAVTPVPTSRRRLLHLLGAAGAAGLAGCTGGDGTSGGGGESGASQSATIAFSENINRPKFYDPWYAAVTPYQTRIFEPLVWPSLELKPKPWLATDWEATSDTTWEFTLRDNVKFHNGKPLNADAAVFSIKQMFEHFPHGKNTWHMDDVRKVDEMTIEFKLPSPYPAFAANIAHNMVAMQHPDRTETEAYGTGPYRVEEKVIGSHVKVSAFEDYWRGTPNIQEMTYRVVKDPNTRFYALEGDDIDVAMDPPNAKYTDVKNSDKLKAHTQVGTDTVSFDIHTKRSPTDDVKLRKALNYAVNQQEIVNSILDGLGQPARGPIAPIIYWSAHDSLPEYGPDKAQAKTLVEESSYNGEPVQAIVSTQPPPVNGDILAQAVQQSAKEVGITVEVRVMEEGAYEQRQNNGEGHLFLKGSGTHSAAADYILPDPRTEDDFIDFTEEYKSAYFKGYETKSPEKKAKIYGKIQQEIMEKAWILPLYYKEYFIGVQKDIELPDLPPIKETMRWEEMKRTKT